MIVFSLLFDELQFRRSLFQWNSRLRCLLSWFFRFRPTRFKTTYLKPFSVRTSGVETECPNESICQEIFGFIPSVDWRYRKPKSICIESKFYHFKSSFFLRKSLVRLFVLFRPTCSKASRGDVNASSCCTMPPPTISSCPSWIRFFTTWSQFMSERFLHFVWFLRIISAWKNFRSSIPIPAKKFKFDRSCKKVLWGSDKIAPANKQKSLKRRDRSQKLTSNIEYRPR